jgi:hypothetical protein
MIDLKKLWEAMPRDVQRKISCHDLKRIVDNYNGPEKPDLAERVVMAGSPKIWWERSEYPHPKIPANMRPEILRDVLWLRFHRVFRGNCFEDDLTGWSSTDPNAADGLDSQNAGLSHGDGSATPPTR